MPSTIRLKHLSGMIPESELNLIRSSFGKLGIGFECIDISREPQASLEKLVSPIILYLSSDIVQTYILGLVTSVSYDIIKANIVRIWRHMSGKMITETTPSGVRSIEADFDLDIKTTGQVSVKFKLKGDIPDNLKEKCIDKAFQLLEAKVFPENRTGYVCIYDVNQDEWEFFELLEFVRKFVKPKDDH